MLAEAFVKGDVDKELASGLDLDDKVEMSEKQRIRCLLLIQTFFSALGDQTGISIKDQLKISRQIKQDFDAEQK